MKTLKTLLEPPLSVTRPVPPLPVLVSNLVSDPLVELVDTTLPTNLSLTPLTLVPPLALPV